MTRLRHSSDRSDRACSSQHQTEADHNRSYPSLFSRSDRRSRRTRPRHSSGFLVRCSSGSDGRLLRRLRLLGLLILLLRLRR